MKKILRIIKNKKDPKSDLPFRKVFTTEDITKWNGIKIITANKIYDVLSVGKSSYNDKFQVNILDDFGQKQTLTEGSFWDRFQIVTPTHHVKKTKDNSYKLKRK